MVALVLTSTALAWNPEDFVWDESDLPVPLCVRHEADVPGWTPEQVEDALLEAAGSWEAVGTPLTFDWRGDCSDAAGIQIVISDVPGSDTHEAGPDRVGACEQERLSSFTAHIQPVEDLETLLRHELGHAIGIAHTCEDRTPFQPALCGVEEQQAVMYWSVGPEERLLNTEDIAAVEGLYGPEPDCGLPPPSDPVEPGAGPPIEPDEAPSSGCQTAPGRPSWGSIALLWRRR